MFRFVRKEYGAGSRRPKAEMPNVGLGLPRHSTWKQTILGRSVARSRGQPVTVDISKSRFFIFSSPSTVRSNSKPPMFYIYTSAVQAPPYSVEVRIGFVRLTSSGSIIRGGSTR